MDRETERTERLKKLEQAGAVLREASKHASDLAVSARMAGATWIEIGSCLGMSRQAAHQRFSPLLPYAFPASDDL